MKRPTRFIVAAMLTAVVLAMGFSWGYLTRHRKQFPHEQVMALSRAIGLAEPKTEYTKRQVKARSPDYLKSLEALGYVDSTYDPEHELRGVITLDEQQVFPGPRFYNDKVQRRARLIDVSGEVLHEWTYDSKFAWGMSTLLDNGDVLVSIKDYWLVRINPDSRRVWRIKDRNHHDIDVFEDTLYTISRHEVLRPSIHPTHRVLDDVIVRYTQQGKLIDTISVLDVVENSPYRFLLPSIGDLEFQVKRDDPSPLDILHTNHVEVMDGSLAHLGKMYDRGNIVTCCRNINLVLVFNPDTLEVLWAWGPTNLTFPHHPRPLASGNFLVFDNGLEASQVIEIDPVSFETTWRFAEEGFFSRVRGGVQRLANGNTLITESDPGYAFEVTPEGETVWKWANPEVDRNGKRGAIPRVTAYAPDATPFIASLTGGS